MGVSVFYRQLLVSLVFFLTECVYATCIVTDDAGELVQVQKPATRIISLAPDMTENLFAIGAGEQIVGVVSGTDYPKAALIIPKVGSYSGLDLERIISLQPDLIVAWGQFFSQPLARLKKMHVPIYVAQVKKLDDIPRTMKNLGCLTGNEPKAKAVADVFSTRLQQLRQQYRLQKPVSVFYQLSAYSLMTINKESWIHEAITLCGGRNIFANAKFISPVVSMEAVVNANPAVILNGEGNADWKKEWQRWHTLSAVKTQSLFTVTPDWVHRAGPRLLDGVEQICVYLQQVRQTS